MSDVISCIKAAKLGGDLLMAAEVLTASRIKALPAAAKVELQQELDKMLFAVEHARKRFQAALDEIYGDEAQALLAASGRDTGTIHLTDGSLAITVEIRKNVVWAQHGPDGLAEIARRIAASGGDPAEYIDLKYAVSERKYAAWPEAMKASFRKARTVKVGKPVFTLALTEEER